MYYPVARRGREGEGRGVATSSPSLVNSRSVSSLPLETRASRTNCENKNGVRFSREPHRFCSLVEIPPCSKVWYRLYEEEGRERHSSKEIEENDIPWISIAVCFSPSSSSLLLLLLSPRPGSAADFFIDNRDSVTSLRESYGSRSSPSSSLFHRFTLRRGRWGGGQRRSWITGQPREWQLTADQIWISKLDDDDDGDLFLRPSIRPSQHFSLFQIRRQLYLIKYCFRSIFQQEHHDGWIDLCSRDVLTRAITRAFRIVKQGGYAWVYRRRSDLRRWQVWEEKF